MAIKLWATKNDISCITQDAFVYVANTGLVLSGGTGAAIYRRGGMVVQDECKRIGKQKHGNVVVTSSGKLPSKYILHAVGMGYTHENIPKLLYDLTTNCLLKAVELDIESLVFPAFTCGRMKNPPDIICENMGKAINDFDFSKSRLSEIGFVLKSDELYKEFITNLDKYINNKQIGLTNEVPEIPKLPWRL